MSVIRLLAQIVMVCFGLLLVLLALVSLPAVLAPAATASLDASGRQTGVLVGGVVFLVIELSVAVSLFIGAYLIRKRPAPNPDPWKAAGPGDG